MERVDEKRKRRKGETERQRNRVGEGGVGVRKKTARETSASICSYLQTSISRRPVITPPLCLFIFITPFLSPSFSMMVIHRFYFLGEGANLLAKMNFRRP